MHESEENPPKSHKKVDHFKKLTSRIPQKLYKEYQKLLYEKHGSFYGHFNQEVINALESYLKQEMAALEKKKKEQKE